MACEHPGNTDSGEFDTRLIRTLVVWNNGDLEAFLDQTSPPGPIRRFIRHADPPALRGVLIEVLTALHRTS